MSKPGALLAAGALFLVLATEPSLAGNSCACRLPVTGKSIVGRVIAAKGAVFLSQATGMVPAAEGSPLRAGSRMITGPHASASLRLGAGCTVSLTGGSDLMIVTDGNNLCVRKSSQASESPDWQSQGTTTTSSFGYPLPGLSGAAGASATLPVVIPSVIIGATIVSGLVIDAAQSPVSR